LVTKQLQAVQKKALLPLRGLNVPKALAEAIDEVVETITTTIHLAADKAIPKARLSERSKLWWSTELATL